MSRSLMTRLKSSWPHYSPLGYTTIDQSPAGLCASEPSPLSPATQPVFNPHQCQLTQPVLYQLVQEGVVEHSAKSLTEVKIKLPRLCPRPLGQSLHCRRLPLVKLLWLLSIHLLVFQVSGDVILDQLLHHLHRGGGTGDWPAAPTSLLLVLEGRSDFPSLPVIRNLSDHCALLLPGPLLPPLVQFLLMSELYQELFGHPMLPLTFMFPHQYLLSSKHGVPVSGQHHGCPPETSWVAWTLLQCPSSRYQCALMSPVMSRTCKHGASSGCSRASSSASPWKRLLASSPDAAAAKHPKACPHLKMLLITTGRVTPGGKDSLWIVVFGPI